MTPMANRMTTTVENTCTRRRNIRPLFREKTIRPRARYQVALDEATETQWMVRFDRQACRGSQSMARSRLTLRRTYNGRQFTLAPQPLMAVERPLTGFLFPPVGFGRRVTRQFHQR